MTIQLLAVFQYGTSSLRVQGSVAVRAVRGNCKRINTQVDHAVCRFRTLLIVSNEVLLLHNYSHRGDVKQ